MINKKDVLKMYKLPKQVKYCKHCTMSNQRPRITFNKDGVCSACSFNKIKRKIDWKLREKELSDLCDKHRKSDGSFDVIVPCSGGKDGGVVAHQLKYKYGMTPLCVTWAPMLYTDIGRRNLDSFIQSGFDHILGTANPKTTRKLTKLAFLHLGDPFQPFIYGQTNFPLKMAIQHNVSLIFYGENGEVEYGGDMKNAYKPTRDISDHDKHYFSGLAPEFWVDHGVSLAELNPFQAPSYENIIKNETEIHFFSYYKYWDPQENFYYCREHTGFLPNSERSQGTYSKYASLDDKIDGFHYYLSYIKFGIGRATGDASHEIRDQKITREEGVALIKKFDHEFPRKYYKTFLEYIGISENEFEQIIDSWRSDHIWINENDEWRLRMPVWDYDINA